MSYDLYLRPNKGLFSEEAFREYFSSREKYQYENSQVWYENEDTGVYFLFELHNENDREENEEFYPVLFNMNYFRPSYFVNEAEPELANFVRYFSMEVYDPQTNGMGRGPYNSDKFRKGWNRGNELGYKCLLKDNPKVYTLPAKTLNYIWDWNFNRNRVQESVTDDLFIPLIIFLTFKGKLVTAVIWPDAIPSLLPVVDILIIPREELAPKRLFKKVEDTVIGLWSDFFPLIERYKVKLLNGGYYLHYESVPEPLQKKVESLISFEKELVRLSFDQVLDAEIVNKYLV